MGHHLEAVYTHEVRLWANQVPRRLNTLNLQRGKIPVSRRLNNVPQSYQVLIPGICKCYLFGTGFWGDSILYYPGVTVSCIIQVGPKYNPLYPCRRRQRDIRHTHREGSNVKVEAETERCSYKSRNVGSYQKEVGRREQILPLSLQRDTALTTPWFQPNENWLQTSDLQNSEKINFCSSKPSSLWWFVTAANMKLMKWALNGSDWHYVNLLLNLSITILIQQPDTTYLLMW